MYIFLGLLLIVLLVSDMSSNYGNTKAKPSSNVYQVKMKDKITKVMDDKDDFKSKSMKNSPVDIIRRGSQVK